MTVRAVRNMMINVRSLLGRRKIDEAAKLFINAIKDTLGSDTDFWFFEDLFLLDKSLERVNRNHFWAAVDKFENEEISNVSDDIESYVDLLRTNPKVNDPFRIRQLELLSDGYAFQYLFARSSEAEGNATKDKTKLKDALDTLEVLSKIVNKSDDDMSYNEEDFMFVRANTLSLYVEFLSRREAKVLLDKELEDGWIERSGIRNHIVGLEKLFSVSIKVEEDLCNKIELAGKEIKKIARESQTSNMETLTLFIAIIGLMFFGGGAAIFGDMVFYERIKLLLSVSFTLIMTLSIFIGLLREKIRFLIVGFIVAAILLGMMIYS